MRQTNHLLITNLNGEGHDGGRLVGALAGRLDQEVRQLLRHVRLPGRRRPADDQPLLLEQQRGVPLHDRLRGQGFECLKILMARCYKTFLGGNLSAKIFPHILKSKKTS